MAGSSNDEQHFWGSYEQHLEDSAVSSTSSSLPVGSMSAPSSGQYHPFMGFQQQRPANNSHAQAYFLGQKPRPMANQPFAPLSGACRLPPISSPSRPQGPSNDRCTSMPQQPLNNCWSASCRAGEQFAKELREILNLRRQNNTDFDNAGVVGQEEEEENPRSMSTIEKELEAERQLREARKEF